MILLPVACLIGVAALMAATDLGAASVLRHLYLVPTLWAALSRGAVGGGVVGAMAGLLHAPVALPAVERAGLTSATLDSLLSLGLPLAAGLLVGRLVDGSRARAARLAAVLAIQRCLDGGGALEAQLLDVADRLRTTLGARRLALLVGPDLRTAQIASVPTGTLVDLDSAAALALESGQRVSSCDLPTDPRLRATDGPGPTPLRALALPLVSGTGVVEGALAIEWSGELPRSTRAAAEDLALHVALAVENARLTLRQRGFAEELAEKVAAATARLRELDRAKSEFLSVVSHELRTPLTALQGFSELLLRSALPPDKAHRCLVYLHAEACALGRIVGELLDLSRIEIGRPLELRPEAVDLDELMERNVELFAAEHRGHRFGWTRESEVALQADPDALDRMVKNLLSNAVKYSPEGGKVSLSACPAPDRPGMVELAVEDDGVGIPADQLPRIFDRYVRVPHPETAATRGLGLGLSLVKTLAEAHGGSVEVDSLPGKGSRFRLLLPGADREF